MAGCASYLGFKLVVILSLAAAGLYKANDAGVEPDVFFRQPALAVAAIGVMAHGDLEFVSLDKYRGTLTLRQTASGLTSTLRPEQVLRSDVFESLGAIGNLFGPGRVTSGIPDWVPRYPGSRSRGVIRQDADGLQKGVASYDASTGAEIVADYYEKALREAGLEVRRLPEASPITLSGSSSLGSRDVRVVVTPLGATSSTRITFSER